MRECIEQSRMHYLWGVGKAQTMKIFISSAILLVFLFLETPAFAAVSGKVIVWGNGDYGQTNVPSGLTNVAAVAAGATFVLALRTNGTVAAWGDNTYGQTNVPVGLSNVIAIAAGDYATGFGLALKSDTTVVAWGDNSSGQRNVPAGLSNVVGIAAGGSHGIAVKNNGTVVTWGSGMGTNAPASLTNAVAVAAGWYHGIALRSDGTVAVWGDNSVGQTNTPVSLGLTNIVAVAAGALNNLVVRNDGTVIGWGYNPAGSLTVPIGFSNIVAVAAGGSFDLVLKNDGTLSAWGNQSSGLALSIPAAASNVISISASASIGCALVGAAAQAPNILWTPRNQAIPLGKNAVLGVGALRSPLRYQWLKAGTTINGATNATFVITNVQNSSAGDYAVVVTNSSGAVTTSPPATLRIIPIITSQPALAVTPQRHVSVAIAAGGQHSLALINDGTVVGWGDNTYDQAAVPPGLSRVMAIAAGASHSLALRSDGTVVCWGNNAYGQAVTPQGLSNAVAVAAGSDFSLALRNDGTVLAWGTGANGQYNGPPGISNIVAINAGYGNMLLLRSDGQVFLWGGGAAIFSNAVEVAAGPNHSLALLNSGAVVGSGDNSAGQLNVPNGLDNASAVAAGWGFSLAIKYGTVIGWGANTLGQSTPPPNLTNAVAISAKWSTSLALTSDGAVIGWGDDTYGQATIPIGLDNGLAATGDTVQLSATVLGASSYQWQLNGINISGATNQTLTLTGVTTNQAGTYVLVATSQSGASARSAPALLSVTTSPFVITQPQMQALAEGSTVHLNVAAGGNYLFYQWYHDGLPIPEATFSSYSITNITINDAGSYFVEISNESGVVSSSNAVLTVYLRPRVTLSDQSVVQRGQVSFIANATGTAPLTYQWRFNGALIGGASSSSLSLSNVLDLQSGNYTVTVTNLYGSTSATAGLSVVDAKRTLPAGYWPNVKFVVQVKVGPAPGAIVNALEEFLLAYPDNTQTGSISPNFIVGAISDGGTFDPVHFKIKFGPFFDDLPRTLTYELTPPPGTTNYAVFGGTFSVDGVNVTVSGDTNLNLYPLHPADNAPPIDNFININEFTAYAAAWRLGSTWPVEPNPIPIAYMTRAGTLWKGGEHYAFLGNLSNAPLCWVNTNPPAPLLQFPGIVSGPQPRDASKGSALCIMTNHYSGGMLLVSSLNVTPATNVSVYALEDQFPVGLLPTNLSNGGVIDGANHKVKWGPFFDTSTRALTYQLLLPTNATGVLSFAGTASFDGVGVSIGGVRQVTSFTSLTSTLVQAKFSKQSGFSLNLAGGAANSYVLQASTNLSNWVSLQTNLVISGTLQLQDASATNFTRRFYRAVAQ